MVDNTVLIAISDIENDIAEIAGEPVEDRLRAAMKLAQNHWLVTDEEAQFQAAIGAVLFEATDEEKERIEWGLNILKGFSAASAGVPVDIVKLIENPPKNPIRLKQIWDEAKGKANA